MNDKIKKVLSSIKEGRTKVRTRIQKIGIELEGGWITLPTGTRVVHDGSVRLRGDEHPQPPNQIGELPSMPLDLELFPKWVKKFYPTHFNETCGMHVHLSFRNALIYQRLMDRSYQETILEGMRIWAGAKEIPRSHTIWSRLAGDNGYCSNEFLADQQARLTQKTGGRNHGGGRDHNGRVTRGTIVNYCYSMHSTLEIRLLPMMRTPDEAIEAIQELIHLTNAFLVATAKKEEKERLEVGDTALFDVTREEIKICV